MAENTDFKNSIRKLLYRAAAEAANAAQQEAPYRTGNLRNDIKVYDDRIANMEIRIANSKLAYYAPYVHGGTGLFGPKKTVIRPKNKKALRTPWGPRAFVRGQKANPYMTRGFKKFARKGLPKVLEQAREEIGDSAAQAISDAVQNVVIRLEL